MAEPGSPDWWLDRLYKKLRDRQPRIDRWNDWYTGNHPVPRGYEDAEPLFQRLMETIGLNMMAVVTDAPLGRMSIAGFKAGGTTSDDIHEIWETNNFARGAKLVRQEKMSLSEAYVMVDPNLVDGTPRLTGEHPSQCIVEYAAGSHRDRVAGLKVWLDDTTAAGPMVYAFLDLGARGVYTYAARTRATVNGRSSLAIKPAWELQQEGTGANPLGEVAIVAFPNRGRMLDAPVPEFHPALPAQRRINKTLLDRMAMQDQGAFKAMWATGLKIPRDPVTGQPIEQFIKAVNRVFVNENPDGKYGQLQAEDIEQILAAVRDDIADCAILVPTSPDQVLAKLVNVSGDGLKLAQVSEVKRSRDRIDEESDGWEDVARLALKAAGKKVPNRGAIATQWHNPEYRTDTEQANAAQIAIQAGMPHEVAWQRYFNATPDEINDWRTKRAQQLQLIDPTTAAALAAAGQTGPAAGGDPQPGAGG